MTKKGKHMMDQRSEIYLPPWRDVTSTGLSEPYGPSPATYARHVARHRQWAYQRQIPGQQALDVDASDVRALLLDASAQIPAGERAAGDLVYRDGWSVRSAARSLQLSRRSVRVQLDRLRRRCTPGST